jgi:hypothetical protein
VILDRPPSGALAGYPGLLLPSCRGT